MKKAVVLLIALFLLPIVAGDVFITSSFKEEYNMNDVLQINGFVAADKDTLATLYLILDCDDTTQTFTAKLDLKKGEKATFEELEVNQINLPSFMETECKVKASYAEYETESSEFSITGELMGIFDVKQDELQLGEELEITGTIYKLDGENIDGLADIYLSKDGERIFLGRVDVEEGIFSFKEKVNNKEKGEYAVEAEAKDNNGNNMVFETAELLIKNEISIEVTTNEVNFMPKETLEINGKTLTETPEIGKAKAYISFLGESYEKSLWADAFTQKITIPKDAKSGIHTLKVKISDPDGNFGEQELDIIIGQVETTLKLLLNNYEFLPGDRLRITATLKDQADDIIEELLTVHAKDPDGKIVFDETVDSGKEAEIEFTQYSLPGTYKINVFSKELEEKDEVELLEYRDIEASYDNQVVYIRNTGNTDYKRTIEIIVKDKTGEEITISKDVDVDPNATVAIDLSKELSSGVYDVYINDGEQKLFANESIADKRSGFKKVTGSTVIDFAKKVSWVVLILAIIALVVLSYVIYKRTTTGPVDDVKHKPDEFEEKKEKEKPKINLSQIPLEEKKFDPEKDVKKHKEEKK